MKTIYLRDDPREMNIVHKTEIAIALLPQIVLWNGHYWKIDKRANGTENGASYYPATFIHLQS